MANSRLNLQKELEELTNVKVYFQPPENVRLTYPCVLYELSDIKSRYANNHNYLNFKRYTVTVVTTNPDSTMAESIMKHFEKASFDRRFKSDNLYHDVVTLYY